MKKSCAALILGLFGIATQLSAAPVPARVICPMVYQPSTCSYEEFSAEGGNKCFARAALISVLEKNGVDYDPADIRCSISAALLNETQEEAAQ